MDVSVGQLRAGAGHTYQAARFADHAAQRLSAGVAAAGVFGAFDAAEAFHVALSDAHSYHARALRHQSGALGALGDGAHTAASAFVATEARNAAAVRAVR